MAVAVASVVVAGLRTALPARRSALAGSRVASKGRVVARAAKVATTAPFDADHWMRRVRGPARARFRAPIGRDRGRRRR